MYADPQSPPLSSLFPSSRAAAIAKLPCLMSAFSGTSAKALLRAGLLPPTLLAAAEPPSFASPAAGFCPAMPLPTLPRSLLASLLLRKAAAPLNGLPEESAGAEEAAGGGRPWPTPARGLAGPSLEVRRGSSGAEAPRRPMRSIERRSVLPRGGRPRSVLGRGGSAAAQCHGSVSWYPQQCV